MGRASRDIDPADHERSGDRDRRELGEPGIAGAAGISERVERRKRRGGAATTLLAREARQRRAPRLEVGRPNRLP